MSDALGQLVKQRTALMRDFAATMRRFADDLAALDEAILTKQRENVTDSTSAMLAGPYRALEQQIAELRERLDREGTP